MIHLPTSQKPSTKPKMSTSTNEASKPQRNGGGKQERFERWLTKHFHKSTSDQSIPSSKDNSMVEHMAPQITLSIDPSITTLLPVQQMTLSSSLAQLANASPLRSTQSGDRMTRDINNWLEGSMTKPAAPLMAGLSYWREGNVTGAKGCQYAIPIANRPQPALEPRSKDQLNPRSHGDQIKSLCRRAARVQGRIPSLRRTGTLRPIVRKTVNRRSASMPMLAISYEDMVAGTQPIFTGGGGILYNERPATADATMQNVAESTPEQPSPIGTPLRGDSPATIRILEPTWITERIRGFVGPSQDVRRTGHARSGTAATREDSVGSFSDAPTYSSGLPPPSYRSRAPSAFTTSSFGCVDGLNPAQRQSSQPRSYAKGMKGKFMQIAQRAFVRSV